MKVKVRIQFYDTVNKKVQKVGDIIDVTPTRFNEILKKGRFVEAVEDNKPAQG